MHRSATALRSLVARHSSPLHSTSRTTSLSYTRTFSSSRSPMFALTPYRQEQPRTFTHTKSLPRLPVPPLEASLEKYIKSLRPFLLDQAAKEGENQHWVEKELDKRREMAKDFERGLGRVLQERLKGNIHLLFPSFRPDPIGGRRLIPILLFKNRC